VTPFAPIVRQKEERVKPPEGVKPLIFQIFWLPIFTIKRIKKLGSSGFFMGKPIG
jgi:hypothetical protein